MWGLLSQPLNKHIDWKNRNFVYSLFNGITWVTKIKPRNKAIPITTISKAKEYAECTFTAWILKLIFESSSENISILS